MSAILIRQGRVLCPKSGFDDTADVLLLDGVVEAVSKAPIAASVEREIDARGKWVVPGLIDLHVHFREPGQEGKENILTGSRAAVAGGFTTVVAMPNTQPVNDNFLVTRLFVERALEANLCRVLPAGAITKGLQGEELAEMGALVDAGCICVTDDGHPVMNAGLMRRALQYAQQFDIPVMVHEEDLHLSKRGAMTEGPRATRMGLSGVPPSAEVAMVARDLILTEETGGRLHVAHVSCAGSVELIRAAKLRGLRVTAEAAPHHFILTDEAVDGYNTHAKMNPPLRHAHDVLAIRQGLADGTIDAIATDHAPHGILDKACEFDCAMNGIVGLETAVPLTLELVRERVLSPLRAIELLSWGPSRIFGFKSGRLEKGAPADVTLIDADATWTVDAERFYSKSRNTPFHGRKVQGRVSHTLVSGRVVFENGKVVS